MWPMHQPEGDDELPLLDMRMWAAGGSLIDVYGRLTSKLGLNTLLEAAWQPQSRPAATDTSKLGLNALLKAASEREQGSD